MYRITISIISFSIGFLACIVAAKIGINQIFFAFTFIIAGMITGGMWGGYIGRDKTIQMEEMTDSEINEAMDKLRKKARIRDYR